MPQPHGGREPQQCQLPRPLLILPLPETLSDAGQRGHLILAPTCHGVPEPLNWNQVAGTQNLPQTLPELGALGPSLNQSGFTFLIHKTGFEWLLPDGIVMRTKQRHAWKEPSDGT